MLLGPGGVGKTSLKRGLMGLQYDPRMNSTIVADVHGLKPVPVLRDGDDGDGSTVEPEMTEEDALSREWVTGAIENEWKEISKDDEIGELAGLVAYVDEVTAGKESSKVKPVLGDVDPKYLAEVKKLMNSEILDEAFKQAKQMQKENIPPPVKPSPFFHMWDCGGQPVFQEVLPVFLTSRTMFLLLFNAKNDLKEYIESVQYRFGEKIQQGFVNMTTLQLLEGWMSNIHSYLLKKDKDEGYLEYPRIIPVGTRGDQLTGPEQEKVLQNLQELCYNNDKAFCKVLKDPVIIDNTKAGQGKDEDPTYKYLRDRIAEFAIGRLTESTPITWVLYRKVLQLVCRDPDQKTINLSQAKAIGFVCKVPPDSVDRVLRFYHELGVLLYYPEILPDKVILDPKWFVDCLGMVLTLPGVGKEEAVRKLEWDLLRNKGILVKPLYVAVWKGCKGVVPDNFIQLLVAFQLAVKVQTKEYDDPSVDQYFIPAVLPYFTQDAKRPISVAPLHIIFKSGYVTPGFFTRLITKMVEYQWCKLYFEEGIFHNRVTYRFGKTGANLVTFTERSGFIAVDIRRLGPDMPVELQKDCLELMNLCELCSQTVEEWLQFSREDLNNALTPRETRVVCQNPKCLSDSVGVHYLVSEPLNGHICCSQDYENYRELTKMEACWYKGVDMSVYALKGTSSSSCDSSSIIIDLNKVPSIKPDHPDVFKLLKPIAVEYDSIGREMGVSYGKREDLKRQGVMTTSESKLEAIIHNWMETKCSEVSWKHLIQVLKECGFSNIARDVFNYLINNPDAILKYHK